MEARQWTRPGLSPFPLTRSDTRSSVHLSFPSLDNVHVVFPLTLPLTRPAFLCSALSSLLAHSLSSLLSIFLSFLFVWICLFGSSQPLAWITLFSQLIRTELMCTHFVRIPDRVTSLLSPLSDSALSLFMPRFVLLRSVTRLMQSLSSPSSHSPFDSLGPSPSGASELPTVVPSVS